MKTIEYEQKYQHYQHYIQQLLGEIRANISGNAKEYFRFSLAS
jgi:hypothetical protein